MRKKVESEPKKAPGAFVPNLQRNPDSKRRMLKRLATEGRFEEQQAIQGDPSPEIAHDVFVACQERHSFGEEPFKGIIIPQAQESDTADLEYTGPVEPEPAIVLSLENTMDHLPHATSDEKDFASDSFSYSGTAEDLRI